MLQMSYFFLNTQLFCAFFSNKTIKNIEKEGISSNNKKL